MKKWVKRRRHLEAGIQGMPAPLRLASAGLATSGVLPDCWQQLLGEIRRHVQLDALAATVRTAAYVLEVRIDLLQFAKLVEHRIHPALARHIPGSFHSVALRGEYPLLKQLPPVDTSSSGK